MASNDRSLICPNCSRSFSQKSSLVRHSKRCSSDGAIPSRRRSCQQCVMSKARCDWQRPVCERCRLRDINCEFSTERSDDKSESHVDQNNNDKTTANLEKKRLFERGGDYDSPHSASSPNHQLTWDTPIHNGAASSPSITPLDIRPAVIGAPEDPSPEMCISEARRQILLGTAPNSPADAGAVSRHIMSCVIRVLRSWPRMMDSYGTTLLPPMIHRVQLDNGIPAPLANCYTLVRMWMGHVQGSDDLVRATIVSEVQRILGEYPSYGDLDLLAAAQSLLILLIILLFCMPNNPSPPTNQPEEAELLVQVWDVTQRLTSTGLFLDQESRNVAPPWKDWAIVSAKRRTILALHHVEWAWSQQKGYPVLTCFELGPLPATAPGFLWKEENEARWEELYQGWLRRWLKGSYKMAELFRAASGDGLGIRGEMWLAEVDEFGMMLVTESKYPLPPFRLLSSN